MWKLRYIAPLSLLALALARAHDGLAFGAVAMMAWAGLALAVRFRPSLATVVGDRRLPMAVEWSALAISLVIAYLAFGAVDQLFIVATTSRFSASGGASRRVELLSNLLPAAWLLLALAPAAVQVARPGERAARIALRGLAGAIPLGVALFLIWEVAGKDLAAGRIDASLILRGLTLIPVCGVLASFGGILWARALTAAPTAESAFQSIDVFGAVLRCAAGGWAMVAGLAGLRLALVVFGSGQVGVDPGSVLALAWSITIAAVWVWALARLFGLSCDDPWRVGLVVAGLTVFFPVSLAPSSVLLASGRTQIGDASLLAALFLLPVLALLVAACAWLAPSLVRRIAG